MRSKIIAAMTIPPMLCLVSAAAVISNMRTVEPAAVTSAYLKATEQTQFPMTSPKTEPQTDIPTLPPTEPPTDAPTIPQTEPPAEPVIIPETEPQSPAADAFWLPEYVDCAGSCRLWVDAVLQNPELPTGCEVTALDTVLSYYDFTIGKTDLFDLYMPSADVGCSLFDEAFIGDPRSKSGWGCFAPVVAEAACNYLWDAGSELAVYDLSGFELWELFPYLDSGSPVMVWASMELRDITWTYRWTIGGTEAWFPSGEHCMVLTGYDLAAGKIYAADPLKGNAEYDLYRFGEIYNKMQKQAILIS